jgi:hypothetical protein
MDLPTALRIATMRDVDVWKMCQRNKLGGWIHTPDSLRTEALEVVAGEVDRLTVAAPRMSAGEVWRAVLDERDQLRADIQATQAAEIVANDEVVRLRDFAVSLKQRADRLTRNWERLKAERDHYREALAARICPSPPPVQTCEKTNHDDPA